MSKSKAPKRAVGPNNYFVKNGVLRQGFKKWDLTGATVEVMTADSGTRVTATRLALAGPLALLMRKNETTHHVFVTFPSGEQMVLTGKPREGAKTYEFAAALNNHVLWANEQAQALIRD